MKVLNLLLGSCLFASAVSLQAADGSRTYFRFDAGGALQQDVNIRNSEIDGVPVSGAKFTFDPGFRFDVGGGYNFNESVALEFEVGFIYNSIDKFKFNPIFGGNPTGQADLDLFVIQVPLLANLLYTFPLQSRLKPYIGAGAGGLWSVINGQDIQSESDFTFAYQGQAGVNYSLSDNTDIGVGYKFLGTLDQNWGGIKIEPLYNHSILAVFTFKY